MVTIPQGSPPLYINQTLWSRWAKLQYPGSYLYPCKATSDVGTLRWLVPCTNSVPQIFLFSLVSGFFKEIAKASNPGTSNVKAGVRCDQLLI